MTTANQTIPVTRQQLVQLTLEVCDDKMHWRHIAYGYKSYTNRPTFDLFGREYITTESRLTELPREK